MAVNKPKGDNARKGAVKKRSQAKTTLGGASALDEAQQKLGRVHGPETARQKEDRSEIQGRARRTSGREKQTVKKTTKKKSRAH